MSQFKVDPRSSSSLATEEAREDRIVDYDPQNQTSLYLKEQRFNVGEFYDNHMGQILEQDTMVEHTRAKQHTA